MNDNRCMIHRYDVWLLEFVFLIILCISCFEILECVVFLCINSCFSIYTTGFTLWKLKITKEQYVYKISRFLYKNFSRTCYREHLTWCKISRIHLMKCLRNFSKVLYFRKCNFSRIHFEIFRECLINVFSKFLTDRVFRGQFYREHIWKKLSRMHIFECFRNFLPMFMFSIAYLSRTYLVNFSKTFIMGICEFFF